MRTLRGILVAVTLLALASSAAAESFDEMSDSAVKVSGDKGLAALFWSQTSSCSGIDNDVHPTALRTVPRRSWEPPLPLRVQRPHHPFQIVVPPLQGL